MHARKSIALAIATAAGLYLGVSVTGATVTKKSSPFRPESFDPIIRQNAQSMLEDGKNTFRFDTFGDEDFWGGALHLHEAIEGSAHGGVGSGLTPRAALGLGLKIDAEALPPEVIDALKAGQVNLDDPNVTLQLLRANAVVGLTGFSDESGGLRSVGIQCALCHSTVDNSVAPGVGARLDGWANRDLDVGQIVALAPNLEPLTSLLGVDEAMVKKVLEGWGPGRFDTELILDGKGFRPDGKTAATLIPPTFGLAGVNLGSGTHWNAFVSNLGMHGKGTFFDPRLDNATQFPVAAQNRFGHIVGDPDQITAKLPALQFYQLAIPAPAPPPGSFDAAAAARGDEIFSGAKGKCSTCHTAGLYTEPGWNMHTGEEIGIDNFQADRSPDHRYRTSPLRGLWTHAKGGFYHDGRFADLPAVVNHYDTVMALSLTDQDKNDLVEYLKSIGGSVDATVASATTLNGASDLTSGVVVITGGWRVIITPTPAVRGVPIRVSLAGIGQGGAPKDLATRVFDIQGHLVANVEHWTLEPERGVATAGWDGRDSDGNLVAAGSYFVRVSAPSTHFQEERKVVLR